jgi:ABC-type cobalamin transport system ATPase subunit
MERHIKPVVLEFPPPVTDGQQEWERRLASQLRAHLPEDHAEARQIANVMKVMVDMSGREWELYRLACYILGMFPEDNASARRIVSLLSCLLGEDGA